MKYTLYIFCFMSVSSVYAQDVKLIPQPVELKMSPGGFQIRDNLSIGYNKPEAKPIAEILAKKINTSTGYQVKTDKKGKIMLSLNEKVDPALGKEGYTLVSTSKSIKIEANEPAGLFYGVQTLLQLAPKEIESSTKINADWKIPAVQIRDYPRFAWRGAMLDVARHFFSVADVEHYIDLLAYYKFNHFHLHLTDDQGWRLAIDGWPKLTTVGGSTAVGGDAGGYYTQADYRAIVAYAQARYITVVPEIDLPGHSNAALASYPELNCDGVAPALYTGTEVGFSSFCGNKELTFSFLTDVIKAVAALTPGPYIHIGGDESKATNSDDYVRFVERAQSIVAAAGKQMIGWEEIVAGHLLPTTLVQDWNGDIAAKAVAQGSKVIVSTASKAYMDMKYDSNTPLGQNWAGLINVKEGYTWDPATLLTGIGEADIVGVEAALWTETIRTRSDIEYMTLPRLPGYAEIGWSVAAGRTWAEYKSRLSLQGARWEAMGVNFYRSPEIPWP